MNPPLEPASVGEVVDAVRSLPRLLPVGAQSKPRLTRVAECIPRISLSRLQGLVEYEPDEFTFTARAGTPIAELEQALGARGQYLPFDPFLMDAGATLGGTVASGLSGPGRFRYGGLRDFILGVQFVDGLGRLLRLGGKVVKNAAGFDVPKFMVGSLGRYGILTELTFKVFPLPLGTRTLRWPRLDPAETLQQIQRMARGRWEADAIDIPPDGALHVRLRGAEEALPALARDLLDHWPGEVVSQDAATTFWTGLREFRWAHPQGWLGKMVLTSSQYPGLQASLQAIPDARMHLSAGGSVAYLSFANNDPLTRLGPAWLAQGLRVLTLQGPGPLRSGIQTEHQVERALKQALDPENRFPGPTAE